MANTNTTTTTEEVIAAHGAPGCTSDGGVRFYGWAPELDACDTRQILSVHERRGAKSTDKVLPVWFKTHKEAETFVAAINRAAPTPVGYRR